MRVTNVLLLSIFFEMRLGGMEGNLFGTRSLQLASKRLLITIFTLANLVNTSGISTAFARWGTHWWINRVTIVRLTAINLMITAGTEALTRSVATHASGNPENNFLIRDGHGFRIHRQTQINLLMTFFASLFGGPVYFFLRRRWRFGFFVSFGLCNSFISQFILASLTLGAVNIAASRLCFDLFYNGTIKFLMFEFWRPMIIKTQRKFLHVSSIRVTQDLGTTILKVVTLNALGFKG